MKCCIAVPFTVSPQHKSVLENAVFGKSKKEKLEAKLTKLLEEVYKLSQTNRKKSDEKAAEAEELRKQIDAMD